MKTVSLRWPSAELFSGILLALTFGLLGGCGGSASVGGGGTTSSSTGTTTTPAITISSISPKAVPVGSSAVTVTVAGSGFPTDSSVVLNGVAEPTTFVSSTQLQATVPATQLQTGQVLTLAVRTATVTTNASTGTALQVDNPVPTVTTLAPAATLIGSGSTTVTMTGTTLSRALWPR
jgi:trimeric autotransporter adhesin